MNDTDRVPVESEPDARLPASPAGALDEALRVARGWAGPDRLALLLSGSHATGEAVWVEHGGRRMSLSDVDLYAVMPTRAACRAAAARARADRAGLGARLEAAGLAAPLEVGFFSATDFLRLPARPSTLELARHARVVDGDPKWAARVPRRSPADIPREELLLLLENRAFELLAGLRSDPGRPLARARARHATLKCALDLATVDALAAGVYPDGAAARVAWARARHAEALEPPWEAALAWRREGREPEPPGPAPGGGPDAEWIATARGWAERWRALVGGGGGDDALLERAAGRARLRRRLRLALGFRARGGRGPALASRLRHALRGTPQHRLDASAAALVLCALERAAGAAEEAAWRRCRSRLRRLGAFRPGASFEEAVGLALEAWDRWVLDGHRFGAAA